MHSDSDHSLDATIVPAYMQKEDVHVINQAQETTRKAAGRGDAATDQ